MGISLTRCSSSLRRREGRVRMRSTRHLARVSMCPELLLLVLAVVTADAGGKNRNGHDADHVQGNLPTNLAAIDGELSRGNTLGPVETLERLGHDGMGGTSYGTGSVSKLMIGGEPIHSTSLRRFVYAAYDPLAIWAAIMGTIWLFLSILWCVRRSSLPRRPTERERSLEPFFEFWPAAMANPWPSWTFKYLPTSASTGSSTPNGPEYYHGGKPLFRESITGIPGRETEVVPLSVLTEGPGFNVSVNLFRCFLTVWLCSSAFAGIPMYLLPFPNEFPIGIVAPILALVFAAIWAIYLDCLDPAVMVRGLEHGAECMTEIEVSSFLESLQGEWDVTMEFKVESRNTLVSPVGGTTAQSAPPHGDSRAEVEVLDGKVHVDNAGGAVCLTFRGVPANALRRQRKLLRQYPADYAATEMEVSGDVPYRMNLLLFRGPTGRVYADNIGTRISVSDDRSTVLIDQHDFEWDVPLAAGKGLLRKTILCQTNLILTRSEPRAGVEVGQLTGEVLGRLQPSAPPSVSELSAQVQIPRETANEPMAIDPSSISPRMDPFPSSEIRLLREEMQMMRREASSSKAQHDMELGALHEEIRVLRQELRVLGGAPADTASDTTESSGAALQPRAMAESSSTLTRPRPTTSHQSPITAHHEEYSHRVRGAPSLRPLNPLGRVDGRGAQHTLAVTPPPAQVVNDNPVEPGEPGDGDAQGKSVTYPGLKLT